MYEHVGAARRLDGGGAGARVAGHDDLPAGARRIDHLLRAYDAPVRERHRFSALQGAEHGAFLDTERRCALRVEASGPIVLDERPPDRRDPVARGEGDEIAAVAPDPVARRHLLDPQVEGELLDPAGDVPIDDAGEPARPVEIQRLGPPLHREGPHEADDPQPVVEVEVREEDGGDVEAGAVPDHLPLRPLPAVDEEELALAPDGEPCEVAPDGRLGAGGAEEGEPEHRGARLVDPGPGSEPAAQAYARASGIFLRAARRAGSQAAKTAMATRKNPARR